MTKNGITKINKKNKMKVNGRNALSRLRSGFKHEERSKNREQSVKSNRTYTPDAQPEKQEVFEDGVDKNDGDDDNDNDNDNDNNREYGSSAAFATKPKNSDSTTNETYYEKRGGSSRTTSSMFCCINNNKSKTFEHVSDELADTYDDTVLSLDQVLNAFTLSERDINAVTKKISKAKEQMDLVVK